MKIKYFAWIKNITKLDEEEIQDSSVVDILSLKKFLINRYPDLKKFFFDDDVIRIAINLEYVNTNCAINAKDEIAVFPPVSGG
tara:strand:+ start:2664 stop:2912 length:249 start_codon:yes stop_codon:yes gene_type:complete